MTSIFKWKDTQTQAQGWVVLDRIINGVSGGGIFMHSKATLEEVADIARNMTKKFTVTVPQIGGAKAGIRFDHKDSRAKDVLRRFIHAHKLLLENVWVTAGDLNTDDSFIERVITQELGLTCCQHRLGEAVAEETNNPNLSKQLARLIKTSANPHADLIEATVGYGVSEAVKTALELKKTSRPRVMIQGFGAVGSNLAYYLEKRQIARVVAICDQDGVIHHPEGLDINLILQRRMERYQRLKKEKAPDYRLTEALKNCLVNLTPEDREKMNYFPRPSDNTEYMKAFLRCERAEVFSPCAFRYCLTEEMVQFMVENTWKGVKDRLVVGGANNPYGTKTEEGVVEDQDGYVLDQLIRHEVMVVPDWVSNSGTAQLFHRGISTPFDLRSSDLPQQVLSACARPIRSFILDAFLLTKGNLVQLPLKCEDKARHQIKHPIRIGENHLVEQINPNRSRYALDPKENLPSNSERYRLALEVGAECVKPKELKNLIEKCPNPVCYDGFEPSGRMHIAQGLLKAINVNKLTQAGFTYIFWVADWFAQMNNKMGGDLEKIREVGRYFIEVWKTCGMDMDRVIFLWASQEIGHHYTEYMSTLLEIANHTTVNRVRRCTQIMGRSDQDFMGQPSSHVFYPCMQCTDIFFLGVDVCQLGMDQRKVNMLAREHAKKIQKNPPIILSHQMLPGLKKGQDKMSKSDPDSAIFMEDTAQEVKNKIKKAYCPEKVEGNPCLAYLKEIVFPHTPQVKIYRREEEPLIYTQPTDLFSDYEKGQIHPLDLKEALTRYLNMILEPIREHFNTDPRAKELFEKVKTFQTTR